MIQFLEFVLALLFLYIFTQYGFPVIWPKIFERNWLFKRGKKGSTDQKVDEISSTRIQLDDDIANTTDDIDRQELKTKELKDKLNP